MEQSPPGQPRGGHASQALPPRMPPFAAQAMLKNAREQALACGSQIYLSIKSNRVDAIRSFLKERVGQEFEIEIAACQEINWGDNRKREAFKCELV